MRHVLSLIVLIASISLNAQTSMTSAKKNLGKKSADFKNWHLGNKKSSKAFGANILEARKLMALSKAPRKVVVAVIDSGVDPDHEDLSDAIWTNDDEIPGNNLDDDGNGYIDDVHGWNFLVTEEGEDIGYENMEATRILRMDSINAAEGKSNPDWLTEEMIVRASEIYTKNEIDFQLMSSFAEVYHQIDSVAISITGKEDYTYSEVLKYKTKSPEVKRVKKIFRVFKLIKISKEDLEQASEEAKKFSEYYLNKDFVTRRDFDYSIPGYGNNQYEGQHADHGTHVAGIIAANSENSLGADGASSNLAEIMIVRAVPDGDEFDLDIANAIRYATDNGAQIINMSFGKGISPHSNEVKKAFKYASDNNVLLVQASGNDSQNNDDITNYPNGEGLEDISLITVGALAPFKNKKLVAEFSNYGKKSVDIFAPGDEIYSTTPDNSYEYFGGTSMAAPVVSGIAALIWAYNPDYSAEQVRELLFTSSLKLKKKVRIPGSKKTKVDFTELSSTGGVIDAGAAFRLAQQREVK